MHLETYLISILLSGFLLIARNKLSSRYFKTIVVGSGGSSIVSRKGRMQRVSSWRCLRI